MDVLTILLNAPSDTDHICHVERGLIGEVELAFCCIENGRIVRNEGFNNLTSRRVGAIIYLLLGCLRVFAHVGNNVAAESHYVQEKAVVRIRVIGCASGLLDLGKDSIVERTALRGYIFFLNDVVDKDARHVIFVVQINWWLECAQSEKRIYGFCVS